jgi:hypothetical protein
VLIEGTNSTAARGTPNLREREGEMARKTGKKGSAIVLLVVVAILAAGPPALLVKAFGGGPSIEASWAE